MKDVLPWESNGGKMFQRKHHQHQLIFFWGSKHLCILGKRLSLVLFSYLHWGQLVRHAVFRTLLLDKLQIFQQGTFISLLRVLQELWYIEHEVSHRVLLHVDKFLKILMMIKLLGIVDLLFSWRNTSKDHFKSFTK